MSVSGVGIAALLLVWGAQASAAPAEPPGCELWTDRQEITHARATGDPGAGAFRCMGYLHGRDRAWQMDFLRRTGQGRTAEILGSDRIRADFTLRLLGLEAVAARIWSGAGPSLRAAFEAYAEGVNSAWKAGVDSYELKQLGYLPEPWKPEDSLLLLLLQSFDQTRRSFEIEQTEQGWLARHGERTRGWFSRDGIPWDAAILKMGEGFADRRSKTEDRRSSSAPLDLRSSVFDLRSDSNTRYDGSLSAEVRALFEGVPELSAGSNNWVLAPGRSRTGHAWLANDPHLALAHPPFWHWLHVEGGTIDVIGASLPGVPFIASGANRHVAWGLTNAYLDVGDLWSVPRKELKGLQTERPWIWVKFGPVKLPYFFKKIERTAEGDPLLPVDAGEGRVLVMRWSALRVEAAGVEGLLEIMQAGNAVEMGRALSRFDLPSWNFVHADTDGHIGFRAVGKVPKKEEAADWGIRRSDNLPPPGSETWLSPSEMPHVLDPLRGFVATANNRHWPSSSRLHGGRGYTEGFRAYRIEELLVATPRHDRDSIARVQCDVQAVDARFLLPRLLERASPESGPELQALRDWDFEAGLDCRACAVYRLWVETLMREEGLNETALFHRLGDSDDGVIAIAAAAAWKTMLRDLPRGDGASLLPWRELHRNRFVHQAGDGFFGSRDRKGLPTPGDKHSVNVGTSRPREKGEPMGFEQVWGASQRLIVELTSPPKVWAQLAGPNLDRPAGELDDEQGPWAAWRDCRYEERVFPVDWDALRRSGAEIRRAGF